VDILCISDDLSLVGLASRLTLEGHSVKLYTTSNKLVSNLFTVTRTPYEAIKECKFIVADSMGYGDLYKWAKNFNKPIIGCSPLTDAMNVDCYREYQIANKLGVKLPPTEILADVGEMFDKVLSWNPARTFVRYDRELITCDHREWLAWAMTQLPLDKRILLQTPTYGEEVSVTGWFDGIRWAKPFILKTNHEKNIRASMLLALREGNKIIETIEPFGQFLKAVDYHGPFTVNSNASRNAIEVVSTHTGFEFPSMYAFFEGLKEPIGEFLHKIAFSVCDKHDITSDYMSSVVFSTNYKRAKDIPIIGIDEGNLKHLFLGGVNKREDDYIIDPFIDWIYTITAHGRDPQESFGRIYHTGDIVKIPEPNFMTNVSSMYKPWLTKLKSLELI
jgi:hypothetical protein